MLILFKRQFFFYGLTFKFDSENYNILRQNRGLSSVAGQIKKTEAFSRPRLTYLFQLCGFDIT